MQTPLQIAFHNLKHSAAVEDTIRDKVDWLEEFCDRITGCRVVVEVPHQHHQRGNLYQVRIDLTVPGEEIAVNREPAEHTAYRDLDSALRDAFDTARRLLEDYVRRMRGDVKTHEPLPHGRVVRLFPEEDYGFLQTPDGREIFFHRHSVLDDGFDRLAVGTEVAFAEEAGRKGPQASTVRIAGHHHHVLGAPG
jgi:cold shock CspA family protein/ribosome-associated translation inhibitor RaiA